MLFRSTDKGTQYEIFVKNVYQAILKAEQIGAVKNIRVEHDIKIEDRFGLKRQVDVYWEYSLAGESHRVGVECRNYNSKIAIEKIDAYATKVQDLKLSKGIMVSTKGFQAGAIKKAEHHGISLIEMREIEAEDFEGYLHEINIEINMLSPARILNVKPKVNQQWIERTYADRPKGELKNIQMQGLNTEIFIHDRENNNTISLFDLQGDLDSFQSTPGEYEHTFTYDNAFIESKTATFDIDEIWVKYAVFEPMKAAIQIDFLKEFLAIMAYVTGEKKRIGVLKDGTQKHFE